MAKPNFILISADQQRADCLGVEGRAIKTPHLDELAVSGTRFRACITPSVVCQPARASILTGQLCRTHGVHDNGIDLRPEVGEQGFAGTLANSGYKTGYFGKAHFSTYHTFSPTGTPECLDSSAQYDEHWFGPYMGFEHVELMLVGHNWFPPEVPPRGQHYERWFHADGKGEQKLELYRANAGRTSAAQTWHSRLPVAWHNSTWTADRAIDWIRNRKDDQPFCTWISFPDPHHPFDCPEPWSWLHDPADVDLPEQRQRDLERRPWWHDAALHKEPTGTKKNADIRKSYSRIPPQSDQQLREIIANTYGQIALVDHQVGRIMQTLAETGLKDNTYVFYFSDHGDWLGDHGLILKGPMHYEGLLRVPMLIAGPDVQAGNVSNEPVSTLDLAPTLYELADSRSTLTTHGESLVALMAGKDAPREGALNEWDVHSNRAGVGLSLRTVRTRTHKLTVELNTGDGELYDLVADPDEMDNLFGKPEAKTIQTGLEALLAQRPDDMVSQSEPVGMA